MARATVPWLDDGGVHSAVVVVLVGAKPWCRL